MTLWYDSSAPGNSPITSSADIYTFGGIETELFIAAISTIIPGQSTGPSVQFRIQSKYEGYHTFQLDYATVLPPKRFSGHLISVNVPSGNPVSIRVIIADNPQEIAATLYGTLTGGGSSVVTNNTGVTNVLSVIYTVPVGYIGQFLSMDFRAGAGGAAKCFAYVLMGLAGTDADWLTPILGSAYPGGSGSSTVIGYGPGNDSVIASPVYIPPTGVLVGRVDAGTAIVDFRIWLRPL